MLPSWIQGSTRIIGWPNIWFTMGLLLLHDVAVVLKDAMPVANLEDAVRS